jgi:hypothetical protein
MPRSIQPDEEGYLYFAKSERVIYGPYALRSTAQGVATQMTPYGARNEFRYVRMNESPWSTVKVANPSFAPDRILHVYKTKLSDFQLAPYESMETKYARVLAQLKRVKEMLEDRGIDIEFD